MTPYISVVLYSRNDDHGCNLAKRTDAVIRSYHHFLNRYRIYSEIILVDYNTPDEDSKLADVFAYESTEYVSVRHIIVPPAVHKRFEHHDKLNMNNMLARNVGIRRAKGEFVLSTCIDVLLSAELYQRLADKSLEKNVLYRIDRTDVNRSVVAAKDPEKMLDMCVDNIVDWHFNTLEGKPSYLGSLPALHTNQAGDFILLDRESFIRLHGFPELDLIGTHADNIFCYMCYYAGIKIQVLEQPERIFHIDHDSIWLLPHYTRILRAWRMLRTSLPREEVMELKDEFYTLAQKVSQLTNEKSRLENRGLRTMSRDEFLDIITAIAEGKSSPVMNGDGWGCDGENFEER